MQAMVNAGLISEKTFSFYMSPYGKDSAMDFGSPRVDRMRDEREMQYIQLEDDFFWSAQCEGFALGNIDNSWQWGSISGARDTVYGGEVYSLFDTGASAIIFPSDYFSLFLDQLYS